ncbi:hypothetical protein IT072_02970 [Leifsonia sp. ZF2019]|uniref:hypothetical protein n=1 Tax=Leifsonia sp. ZF2019 TaxID=2781978 RepID=UPI001CBB229D|nr:hypothetical protein [Leifsonia sp. ZF2019]UAJ80052.1 hypothetical protein IT072_02970 [Leifsonia sp. ZF2019]
MTTPVKPDVRTGRSRARGTRMRASLACVQVAVLSVVYVVAGASILWVGAGSTVVSGTPATLALFLVFGGFLQAGRKFALDFLTSGSRFAALVATLAVADCSLAVGTYLWWDWSTLYFVGWMATFAFVSVGVNGVVAVVTASLKRQGWLIQAASVFASAVAVWGVWSTSDVWRDGVLIPLTTLILATVLIGGLIAAWVRSVRGRG